LGGAGAADRRRSLTAYGKEKPDAPAAFTFTDQRADVR
jgi:hypothetical protein